MRVNANRNSFHPAINNRRKLTDTPGIAMGRIIRNRIPNQLHPSMACGEYRELGFDVRIVEESLEKE
jgi:hypothetical protein